MSINVQRGAAKRENRTPLLEGTADDSVEAEAETVVETGQSGFTIRGEARVMWAMGWPLVVGFMCRFAMATTDSAFLGHLTNSTNGTFLDGKVYTGEQYLAASALSDMVCNILLGPPLAFNQVLNSLVGQALGSGNPKMAGNWLQNSVLWLSLTTVPSIIIMYTQVAPILKLLGFSPEIAHLSGLYAQWNVFWPIPNGIYQCMRFYFQAQGMSRPAMYNSLFFVLFNAASNWLLVFGGPFALLGADSRFRWSGLGFVGAGMSLSVSRCCQPIAYYLYMFVYKKAHLPTWPGWTLGFLRLSRVRAFMAQAVPLIGTQIVQSLIFQATTLLVAQLGTLAVAASSAVGAATQVFTAGLAAAFIAVAAVRIGYHLGRNDVRAAQGSVTLVVAVSLLSSSLSIAICTPLSRQVASLVTDDPTTLPVAASLVGAALVGAGSAQLVGIGTSGVFGGQGRTLVSTILSFGFELPMTLAGVAIPVYLMKVGGGEGLLIVYWAWVVVNVIEVVVVGSIISCSNWRKYAEEAVRRQESNNTARADAAGVPSVDAADEDGAEGPGNPPEAGPGETRAGPPAAGLAGGVRRL